MTDTTTGPLPAELRRLREAAGLSQPEAARRADTTKQTVWRTEQGHTAPSPELVKALCRVYKAPADVRAELVQMAKDGQAALVKARTSLQRGGWQIQEKVGRVEQSARTIRHVCVGTVVGLAQTPAYIDAMFTGATDVTPEDRARVIAARVERQAILDSDREFTIVHTEGALRSNYGSAVMVEQMAKLAELAERPNVRFGVVPFETTAPVGLFHHWSMYDDRLVIMGSAAATAFITDPAQLAEYRALWARLEPVVSWDADALPVVERTRAFFAALV